MSNENFGLSFTIEALASWGDHEEGIQSPAGQFVITVPTDMQSSANQFSPIISSTYQSSANHQDMIGLCAAFSVLSGPGQSILSGPGQNIVSCP